MAVALRLEQALGRPGNDAFCAVAKRPVFRDSTICRAASSEKKMALCSSRKYPFPPPNPHPLTSRRETEIPSGGVVQEEAAEGVGSCLERFFFPGGLHE